MNLTKLSAFCAMLTISGCSELEEGTPDAGSATTDVGSPAADVGFTPRDTGNSVVDTGTPDADISCLPQSAPCTGGSSPCCTPFSCSARDGVGTVCCGGVGTPCTGERGCCGSLECRGGACAQPTTTCSLAEGQPCTVGGMGAACCAEGRECGMQPQERTTCCRQEGQACTLDYGCCQPFSCRRNICTRSTSCDPLATSNNGCPRDNLRCYFQDASGATNCGPLDAPGLQTNSPCTTQSQCSPGNVCTSGRCRRSCNTNSPACPSQEFCRPTGVMGYGVCGPRFLCNPTLTSNNDCPSSSPLCLLANIGSDSVFGCFPATANPLRPTGASCTENRQCAPGNFCSNLRCILYCTVGSSGCPGGARCELLSHSSSTNIGFCPG
jgi:hypothetical protein